MNSNVLCLGYFDCIHLGHRRLLSSAFDYARKNHFGLSIATFDDNFLSSVGRKDKEVFLLSERKCIFHSLGIDDIIVFPSEKEFLSKDRTEFCQYINSLHFKAIFVGSDYKFGKDAAGDALFLKTNCTVPVFIEDIFLFENKKVSSSDIRQLLKKGDVEKVNRLLSVPYFISGIVSKGRNDGQKMKYPTINLLPEKEKELPSFGVYITETMLDGKKYLSVTNVGSHPTFFDNTINIETHLIDFSDNAYGKKVTVYFEKFIREIKEFSSVEELKKQIAKDIETAKEYKNDKIRRCGAQ